MNDEPKPKAKGFSWLESVVRVVCATVILAIVVNVAALCLIAWITGQARH